MTRFKEQTQIEDAETNYRFYMLFVMYYKFNEWKKSIDTDALFTGFSWHRNMTVTDKQLKYEWQFYLNKLITQKGRDKELYEKLKGIELPEPHPLFDVIEGEIEKWEKIK